MKVAACIICEQDITTPMPNGLYPKTRQDWVVEIQIFMCMSRTAMVDRGRTTLITRFLKANVKKACLISVHPTLFALQTWFTFSLVATAGLLLLLFLRGFAGEILKVLVCRMDLNSTLPWRHCLTSIDLYEKYYIIQETLPIESIINTLLNTLPGA